MIEFKYSGMNAYVIHKTDDGMCISDCHNFYMEKAQMLEVAKGLIQFAKKHSKEIEEFNKKRRIEFNKEIHNMYQEMDKITNGKPTKHYEGYIYLFKCGDKYKIGYSKDVQKRIKTLDYRPYPIQLITQTIFLKNAWLIEQEMHKNYKHFNEIGEWYNFSDNQVKEIINYLESLGDE